MELHEYVNEITEAPSLQELPPRFAAMARLLAQTEPMLEVDRHDGAAVRQVLDESMLLLQRACLMGAFLTAETINTDRGRYVVATVMAAATGTALGCQYLLEGLVRDMAFSDEEE